MSKLLWCDARTTFVGDSLWGYCAIIKRHRMGQNIAILCDDYNKSVFEFFQEYLIGCEDLTISTDPSNKDIVEKFHSGPDSYEGPNEDLFNYLRKPLLPIVDSGSYICFQPWASSHNKMGRFFMNLQCKKRGYSVGVSQDNIMNGASPFHNRPISDVARLLFHSDGLAGVFSSMALFSSLLGKKTVVTNFDYTPISEIVPTGFNGPHNFIIHNCGSSEEIKNAVNAHIGDYL